MKYSIEYAVMCDKGKVRKKNQDNFWCMRLYLEEENEGLPQMYSRKVEASDLPAFAVFDGLGGERYGEVAAYIAANGFNELYNITPKANIQQFLKDSVMNINQRICEYATEHCIRNVGTTAAILMFEKKAIHICNIGDSRVYRFRDKSLTQLSQDHLATYMRKEKPPLSQNLGIPEKEFLIQPYLLQEEYRTGERYLICSDGLTDMVSDEEISSTLESKCIKTVTYELMDLALERGGTDNITIIVCDVKGEGLLLRSRTKN